MLNSKDISIVIQGAVDKINTPKCLASVRKYLPNSEIILSTWEDTDISGLDFDKILLNKDPGGADCSRNGKGINNCNREIVSTFEGIKSAARKYCLKLRSDIILQNNKILKIDTEKYKREEKYKFFKSRIVVPSVYSRCFATRNRIKTPVLFHPSDWCYFGLKEDIYSLFDIPLTQEPEFSRWFASRPQERNGYTDSHPDRLWKFSPEAYILTAYLKKNQGINIQDKLDIDKEKIGLSRHILVNNFYMADLCQIGIKMPKYKIYTPLMPENDRDGLYSNYLWQNEYKNFCDATYIVKYTCCHFGNLLVDFFKIQRRKR